MVSHLAGGVSRTFHETIYLSIPSRSEGRSTAARPGGWAEADVGRGEDEAPLPSASCRRGQAPFPEATAARPSRLPPGPRSDGGAPPGPRRRAVRGPGGGRGTAAAPMPARGCRAWHPRRWPSVVLQASVFLPSCSPAAGRNAGPSTRRPRCARIRTCPWWDTTYKYI